MKHEQEPEVTDRALMVLQREARRAAECAERVRLVVEALALRRGVGAGATGQRQR